VTRLRRLTPGQISRLEALRRAARLLDTAFPVPGTSARFGLDPILGLIPGFGDLVAPLFTLGLILQARDIGVPGVVLFRMIANVAIDTIVGLVPLAGDLFDFAWKSNIRNLALLEQHAYEEHPASAGDWTFVIMSIALLLIIAAVPFMLLGWLFSLLSGLIR
jgi:hypothetical protein